MWTENKKKATVWAPLNWGQVEDHGLFLFSGIQWYSMPTSESTNSVVDIEQKKKSPTCSKSTWNTVKDVMIRCSKHTCFTPRTSPFWEPMLIIKCLYSSSLSIVLTGKHSFVFFFFCFVLFHIRRSDPVRLVQLWMWTEIWWLSETQKQNRGVLVEPWGHDSMIPSLEPRGQRTRFTIHSTTSGCQTLDWFNLSTPACVRYTLMCNVTILQMDD